LRETTKRRYLPAEKGDTLGRIEPGNSFSERTNETMKGMWRRWLIVQYLGEGGGERFTGEGRTSGEQVVENGASA
jgi:hypothetical protein